MTYLADLSAAKYGDKLLPYSFMRAAKIFRAADDDREEIWRDEYFFRRKDSDKPMERVYNRRPRSKIASLHLVSSNLSRMKNTRIAFVLFTIYLLLYGGFVAVAAFSPATMEATPLAGVNVAIWYGFGLIVAAIVLALVYGWLCRSEQPTSTPDDIVREELNR